MPEQQQQTLSFVRPVEFDYSQLEGAVASELQRIAASIKRAQDKYHRCVCFELVVAVGGLLREAHACFQSAVGYRNMIFRKWCLRTCKLEHRRAYRYMGLHQFLSALDEADRPLIRKLSLNAATRLASRFCPPQVVEHVLACLRRNEAVTRRRIAQLIREAAADTSTSEGHTDIVTEAAADTSIRERNTDIAIFENAEVLYDSPEFTLARLLRSNLQAADEYPDCDPSGLAQAFEVDLLQLVRDYEGQFPTLKAVPYSLVRPAGEVLVSAPGGAVTEGEMANVVVAKNWWRYGELQLATFCKVACMPEYRAECLDFLDRMLELFQDEEPTSDADDADVAEATEAVTAEEAVAEVTEAVPEEIVVETPVEEATVADAGEAVEEPQPPLRFWGHACHNVSPRFKMVVAPLPTGRNISISVPEDCDNEGSNFILRGLGWSCAPTTIAAVRRIKTYRVGEVALGRRWTIPPVIENQDVWELLSEFGEEFHDITACTERYLKADQDRFIVSDVMAVAYLAAASRLIRDPEAYTERDIASLSPGGAPFKLDPAIAAGIDPDYYKAFYLWIRRKVRDLPATVLTRRQITAPREVLNFVRGLLTGMAVNSAEKVVKLSNRSVLREAREYIFAYRNACTPAWRGRLRGSVLQKLHQRAVIVVTANAFFHGQPLELDFDSDQTASKFPILVPLPAPVSQVVTV